MVIDVEGGSSSSIASELAELIGLKDKLEFYFVFR
jgi:hypothetical protein